MNMKSTLPQITSVQNCFTVPAMMGPAKQIKVFGESRIDGIAKQYEINTVSKLPINPKLAAACDSGMIELFDGNWLDNMASMLEELL